MTATASQKLPPAISRVAIITRTKNRPAMLARAMESVAGQIFRDFVWMLVNDGGEPEAVDSVADTARSRGIDVRVIHHTSSRGMEAASNAGIKASQSEYICIHDDDDTWQDSFLQKCVDFLDRTESVPGVITQIMQINEVLVDNRIQIRSKHPWRRRLHSISLIEMARRNLFPPISFLFRRSNAETIGLFNEQLPVLGDWDFHLRFLARYEIGVLNEYLANYHHRKKVTGVYGNSIHSGIDQHLHYDAIIRNQLLREDMQNGRVGLGWLVNMARPTRSEALAEVAIEALYTLLERTGALWLLRKFRS